MKRYLTFFGWFFLVAIAGTGVIFALTPVLRAYIPPAALSRLRTALLGTPASGVQPPYSAPRPDEPDRVASVRPREPAVTSAKTPTPDSATRPQRPIESPAPPVSRPPPTVATVDESVSFDYGCMWGVVRGIDAYVFDRTGAAVAPADPGTVVEIAAVRTSATDRVAICRFRGRTEPAGLMLMRLDDLAVRSGAFTRADSDLVSLLVRQAVLTGEIGMQKERVAENGSTGNPHAANYRKTRDALREFLKKAQTLKGRFDASRGSERAELVDRLRMMKQEEVQLSQQFTEAKARFDQWNTTHASGGDEPAEIKQMKAELAKIESDIKQFDR